MILIIETNTLYRAYIKSETAEFDYSNSSLKELQNFLKNADESILKEITAFEGNSTFAITADYGAFVGHKISKREKKNT